MFKKFLVFLIIFLIGFSFGHSYIAKKGANIPVSGPGENTAEAFVSEIYDKISQNYWDNISDAQLLELFKLSFDKNGGSSYLPKFDSKEKLITAVQNTIKPMDEDKRNKFAANLTGTVLASLNPAGRSGLFTAKQEEQLKNTVENIDPQKDLYKDLGVEKGASAAAVEQAFQKRYGQLAQDKSPDAQEKIKQITYAKDVLTQKEQKEKYDQKGIEPTISTKILGPDILYFQFKKFSPASLDEFVKAFDKYKDSSLSALIFDLRGNVGGAIDATPYFLGYFMGKNMPAFDFYHKGDYLPFKTPVEKLPSISKYKQVVVLVDNQTQSSAEMMAAAFKKYHLGVVAGVPTKGWGTVEKVFPLDNQFDKSQKYSMFLVHSITLRDDNLPIEGRGVEPDINIKNPNWQQQLNSYFRNRDLIQAVESVIPGV